MRILNNEETFHIIRMSLNADASGNREEATRLIMENFPLAPHLALAAKDAFGVEYLINSGFDLSEAEETYGKDWLNQ